MRPTLIVDFREHSLFALVRRADGELVPCRQEVDGVATGAEAVHRVQKVSPTVVR